MADRTYQDWLSDVRRSHDWQLQLANELRKRWKDWKAESPYKTLDECLQGEFGLSAAALRERNSYRRRKARQAEAAEESVRMPDGSEVAESDQDQDQQPSEPDSTPAPARPRRVAPPLHESKRIRDHALKAASRYMEAMENVQPSEYERLADDVGRVIAEWEDVRAWLQARLPPR